MEFKGIEIYPMGAARLSIVDDKLRVENVSNSGSDGVVINTRGLNNCQIVFDRMPQLGESNGFVRKTSLFENRRRQVVTGFETLTWYNDRSNKVKLGYNSRFIPNRFHLVGRLNGNTVFDFDNSELDNSGTTSNDGDVQYSLTLSTAIGIATLAVAVVALALDVYNTLKKSEKTIIRRHYKDGKLDREEIVHVTDPEPFDVEVNGRVFRITELELEYSNEYPLNLDNEAIEYFPIGEQITCSNIPYFDILTIERE